MQQHGNDSDSSYVDIDEVGNEDDVTGPADHIASSEQQQKTTVEPTDNFLLAKIAALKHKIHFLLSFLGIDLFRSSLNSNHCLHHLYPDKRENTHNMTLRPRGHNF